MTRRIHIHTFLTSWTGYGQIGEWLGRGLESRGVSVTYSPISSDGRYFPPPEFEESRRSRPIGPCLILGPPDYSPPPGFPGPYAHFSMWETDRIPAGSPASLSRAALVVVPCRHNRDAFRASGVTAPIEVVPLGVSADEGYVDDGTPAPMEFRVGMAARLAHGGIRKGLAEGLAAWLATFPPEIEDARLSIKVWPDDLAALDVPADPRIEVVSEPFRPRRMAEWYRSLSVLLVPSKGEGWGLHTHQAMACGRPVIAARYGGTADIMDDGSGWWVPHEMAPAGEFYRSADPDNRWAVPSLEGINAALLEAYYDPTECLRRGMHAARRAAEFTWERTAAELDDALSRHGLI